METEVPGTAGEIPPDSANRRSWPTPLEWTVVVLLITSLSLLIALLARNTECRSGPADSAGAYIEEPAPQGPTVSLEVDFGNGSKRGFSGLSWAKGMTGGDLMHAASRLSPGLEYEVRGSGEMTLLTSLDGVANGEGNGRYWLYEVNGLPAQVSFAVQPVAAGDRVLWVFKRPE